MIDLHSHTKASDGDLLPKQLVELAISLGIEALAITDHDTVDGIEEAIVCHYSENEISPKIINKLGFKYQNSIISKVSNKEIKRYTKKI